MRLSYSSLPYFICTRHLCMRKPSYVSAMPPQTRRANPVVGSARHVLLHPAHAQCRLRLSISRPARSARLSKTELRRIACIPPAFSGIVAGHHSNDRGRCEWCRLPKRPGCHDASATHIPNIRSLKPLGAVSRPTY
ncbi:hypothetical protein BD309DRAFT_195524 [Dichomitus squalens]|uniref:Uncharacterized protein n=1 Tax=Dichomitus squalens TaxID=114155 RepID=A0A4Q9PNC0_9APHY|nr:hypothetical protein BD309DRAFT_195524 [Dichomitus squalens]TBU55767.1 hypothetical protein BD310DRAFT_932977 [Dichomitus squalens]